MPVALRVEGGPFKELPRAEILRRMRAVFVALELGLAELSVVLTHDARIRELNREYRDKDRPTDVLAFAMREGALGGVGGEVLGDVIVSVETARRQANEAGHELLEEVTMLLVHGILHLLGWDHPTAAAERKMRAETARLVALATARRAPETRPRPGKARAPKEEPSPRAPATRARRTR